MIRVKPANIFLGGMILCMVTSQVFLKFAGIHVAHQFDVFHDFLGNSWLWGALLASGAGLICWLMTLRNIPLAVAYPWTALIYVLTPFASVVIFNDILNAKYMSGIASIVLGIFFTSRGVETQ